MWDGTSPTSLDALGGIGGAACDINDTGPIVGYAYLPNERYHEGLPNHASLWQGTTVTDLGTLGGTSQVSAIYNVSHIVAMRSARHFPKI
ncbi:MAG: hypothetical protein H0U72_13655 [Nitrosospira sp.]|nr:hypothetical protein [Nitrosospira sp.]